MEKILPEARIYADSIRNGKQRNNRQIGGKFNLWVRLYVELKIYLIHKISALIYAQLEVYFCYCRK